MSAFSEREASELPVHVEKCALRYSALADRIMRVERLTWGILMAVVIELATSIFDIT